MGAGGVLGGAVLPGRAPCIRLALVIRPERFPGFGRFRSVARSGQKSIAQGEPWVNFPAGLALKGPPDTARIGSSAFEPDRVHIPSPFTFRAKRLFSVNPG